MLYEIRLCLMAAVLGTALVVLSGCGGQRVTIIATPSVGEPQGSHEPAEQPDVADPAASAPESPYEIRLRVAEERRIPRLAERLRDRERGFADRKADLDALLSLEDEFPGSGAYEELIQFASHPEPSADEVALAGTLASRLSTSLQPSAARALEQIAGAAPESTRLAIALALATAGREGRIQQAAILGLATHLANADPSSRVRELLSELRVSSREDR